MAKKFQNKYRIESARRQNWDYGWNGIYSITINTKNRIYYFGKIIKEKQYVTSDQIEKQKMKLSGIGNIANKYWSSIPDYFPYARLYDFVIMPNHMHGIIEINKKEERDTINPNRDAINPNRDAINPNRDAINRVSVGGITGYKNPMLHQNLSRIIRWYKGRVTYESRKINPDFEWQARFHERIIRDHVHFENVQSYIKNNPKKWKE